MKSQLMKYVFVMMMTLNMSSALANHCADADYSCPEGGPSTHWLNEAQATGRVCTALQNAGVNTKELSLDSSISMNADQHYKFLSELKNAMNACSHVRGASVQYTAYYDINLVETSFSNGWRFSDIAKSVMSDQRMRFLYPDQVAHEKSGGGHTEGK